MVALIARHISLVIAKIISMKDKSYISKKTLSRLVTVQAIYSNNINYCEDDIIDANLILDEDIKVDFNQIYSKAIIDYYNQNQNIINNFLKSNSTKHKFANIEFLLSAILKAATAEFLLAKSKNSPIDKALIISEYLQIGSAYYEKKEMSLINGILDKL